ncbi:aspartate 1-decarboxylase [Bradyrhizobium sp. 4]|uniref:aspartate 1-decarboxylase n=1 Tax=unclassified Bradyrhizobium TaxID=2631580 RepID=UPI001FF8F021|nr:MULTISPECIES: aspartate 1-decarboxylase [unclassified Bradyrhizobium]MCK1403701.1 aspartate 1-decarboxylase [Bradyrhizobium sp. 39]MCK1751427.1 aspartate 1-decarboxylase [Bradyrhizobium sp. 135]UPJ36512.1 aspartate 1-decarboxylase [Bradyrhizobium sp. 4]
MQIVLMKGKIHCAWVTESDLHFEGSISIDRALLDAAGILINERVELYNLETGARFATFVTEAPQGSGTVDVNGAAVRLAMPGDRISIVACASVDEGEARIFRPRIVLVDRQNRIVPI